MSRFPQRSDIPPVRLIEFGAEKQESKPLVQPAVVNLRSQRIEQFLSLKNLAANTRRNYERHLKYSTTVPSTSSEERTYLIPRLGHPG